MNKKLVAAVAATALIFSACSSDDDSTETSEGATDTTDAGGSSTENSQVVESNGNETEPTSSETPGNTGTNNLSVVESDLGSIVVADGLTVYAFTDDTAGSGASTCNDGCLSAWPAVSANFVADSSVTGEVSTITRDDGTEQVALNGWPLYFFASDVVEGDTKGQGVNGKWFVVDSAGELIK